MKKFTIVLLAYFSTISFIKAQQPMTIAPGLNITSPTAGTSGLKFNNLNSGTTVSTTPTKVLSLDATGNIILGNAASGGSSTAISVPVYANNSARATAIPTPTTGMLTYNSFAGSGLETYNGSQWITLNYWTYINTLNRIRAPSAGSASIEAARFISQVSSTVALPVFAFTGPSNVFKYSGVGPDATDEAMTQETTTGIQPSATSIVWNHYATTTSTPTRLFGFASNTFTVNGNQTIDGFTRLGGTTSDVPAVKQKYITGNTNSNAAVFTTLVTHGLDQAKIISVNVLVNGLANVSPPQNIWYSPNYRGSNNISTLANEYWVYFDATNITIERSNGQGQNLINKPYKILITYIQ